VLSRYGGPGRERDLRVLCDVLRRDWRADRLGGGAGRFSFVRESTVRVV
jgi:hypothetical protein